VLRVRECWRGRADLIVAATASPRLHKRTFPSNEDAISCQLPCHVRAMRTKIVDSDSNQRGLCISSRGTAGRRFKGGAVGDLSYRRRSIGSAFGPIASISRAIIIKALESSAAQVSCV
jgi:hypothetical protein